MKQGSGANVELLAGVPPHRIRRLLLGLTRRLKSRLLPGGERLRRVPFGVTRGLRIRTDLHGPSYLPLGLYEYEVQAWMRRLAAPGGTAYDIGAASGVQTLALARCTGRPVVAFEKDGAALDALKQHAAANAELGQLVQVHERFVGGHTTTGQVALDDFIAGREPPTMIKIDVEGAELEVLRGGMQLLRVQKPHLLIETHGADLETQVGELLLTVGYRPVVIPRRRRLREDRPAVHNRWMAAVGAPPTAR